MPRLRIGRRAFVVVVVGLTAASALILSPGGRFCVFDLALRVGGGLPAVGEEQVAWICDLSDLLLP